MQTSRTEEPSIMRMQLGRSSGLVSRHRNSRSPLRCVTMNFQSTIPSAPNKHLLKATLREISKIGMPLLSRRFFPSRHLIRSFGKPSAFYLISTLWALIRVVPAGQAATLHTAFCVRVVHNVSTSFSLPLFVLCRIWQCGLRDPPTSED